ncbi:hypothetical protein HRbin36_00395 [bacterium HR36]|nr:hypothetical protein HRbin36_00395 [bacterium HR36]
MIPGSSKRMAVWLPICLWAGGALLLSGCQTPAPDLHQQLVRGSAAPDEATENTPSGWWPNWGRFWDSWFGGQPSGASSPAKAMSKPHLVRPEDVTPATAWNVLQQLRNEVQNDLANTQD